MSNETTNNPAADRKNTLRKTLLLPKTNFPMKANLLQMEPRFQKRWEILGLYERMREQDHPVGSFIFHDGPPYANGNIHLGHLLNKVLKDIVVRSHLMQGYDVDFVPGWDCHGLPIEHQVMKELGDKAKELVVPQIRNRCQSYAEKFVKIQTKQMKRLGTLGHYEEPYLTMKPQYEADTLEVFASLVERGLVYRDLKPVHWSIANRTALADAELEYRDRKDTSVYVLFELTEPSALPATLKCPTGGSVYFMIWTTTPWTLPANLAVAVSPSDTYGLYRFSQEGEARLAILAEALAQRVLGQGGAESIECLGTVQGSVLVDAKLTYRHPFVDRTNPVVTADYVTMEDGTGMVHTAPGHGEEDYRTGLKEGLDIYCPVRADGTYDDTVPDWLQGKDVWTANGEVTEHLRRSGHLFYDHTFEHSYPHDWRSKTPTIFRATDQWFIAVDRKGKGLDASLRQLALRAADESIRFTPDWGRSRLRGMLESRPDWCISRQRAWGLPIPAFFREGEEALLTPTSIRAVIAQVRKHGSDCWFRMNAQELLGDYDPAQDPDAPMWLRSAGKKALEQLNKSSDIFDVWFESGSSWNAVLKARDIGFPSALYLEGSDQHRGWFQLSLLPALGATGKPPFEHLLTHGFIVNAKGQKMSKSLGNAIEVDDLLTKHGADVCRWWVCSLNFVNDIKADWSFFQTASDEYRKIRNTLRFLLSNLGDFDPTKDRKEITNADRHTLDAWVLQELHELQAEVTAAYQSFQYRRIRDGIFNFCNDTLSAVYMAAIKDRMYCEAMNSPKRRRTQTTLFDIAETLIRLIAPVLVHTADEAFLSLHNLQDNSEDSVHFTRLPDPKEMGDLAPNEDWDDVLALRHEAMKCYEEEKGARDLGSPLDVELQVTVPKERFVKLQPYVEELADLCGVSRFELKEGVESVIISDLREEPRCDRSWKRDGTVRERDNGFLLTDRDATVMAEQFPHGTPI